MQVGRYNRTLQFVGPLPNGPYFPEREAFELRTFVLERSACERAFEIESERIKGRDRPSDRDNMSAPGAVWEMA